VKLGVATAFAFAVVACTSDPKIPLNQFTTRTCWDGTVCPTWESCPNYSTPGRCEQGDAPPTQFGYRKSPYELDAGRD
jgi:hypothetical protein